MIRKNPNGFATEVCAALGLRNVTKLTLVFEVNSAPQVHATCVVTEGFELVDVVRRFVLTASELVGEDIDEAPMPPADA